jgi:peptidoglycan/LPS O-acetylase OafA/YrhL
MCAMLVLANHLRASMFVPFSELDIKVGHFFYILTSLGHQAVIVFFVISGYLVGGGILGKYNKFDFKEYMISRGVRLYVVLIPALALTLILDIGIDALSPEILSGEYFKIFHSGPTAPIESGIYALVINLMFLQDIVGPIFGSNTPLWSLAYEFQYYLMFPALLILIGRFKRSFYCRLSILLIFLLMAYFYEYHLFVYFPIWVLGAVTSKLPRNKTKYSWAIISSILFLLALLYPKLQYFKVNAIVNDYILAISVALLIYSMKSLGRRLLNKQVTFLTDISYTLYLIHFPIVLYINAVMKYKSNLLPGIETYTIYFIWLLVITFISRGIWWLFERQTDRCKLFIRTKILNF